MAFHVDPKARVSDEIVRLVDDQLGKAEAALVGGDDAVGERVHDARKGIKKARSLMRLVRGDAGRPLRHENLALQAAARKLSDLRDARAVVATFEALVRDAELGETARLVHERLEARARDVEATSAGPLAEVRAAVAEVRARASSWGLDGDLGMVRAGVRRILARARDAMRAAVGETSAARMHDWRKRAKDHAHLVALVEPLWSAPFAALRDEADALADRLGDHHNLAVLAAVLAREPALTDGTGDAAARIDELVARRARALEQEAFALGHRLDALAPRALARTLRRLWKIARSDEKR